VTPALIRAAIPARPGEPETAPRSIVTPFPQPPAPGALLEVAPGLFWGRMPLPLRLDHVNIYVIEDGPGIAVVDCGMRTDDTLALWERLLEGPLRGRPVTRIIVTHFHPDHVGAAGWLAARTGAPIAMTETEYLLTVLRQSGGYEAFRESDRAFFRHGGLGEAVVDGFLERGPDYQRTVAALPCAFERLRPGQTLRIGTRGFTVLTGEGHSDDQAMLYSAADHILISADQVMLGITPNIAVWPMEPESPALDNYRHSLRSLRSSLPDDVLVLPGHKLPFRGLRRRIDELIAHHEDVCDTVIAACGSGPRTVPDLLPHLFHRELNAHHTVLAFAEALAHVLSLLRVGRLVRLPDPEGILRVGLP
jgi:glyoxylase-like metal-dependent hydrolase (beta-lactamase superfamily II)